VPIRTLSRQAKQKAPFAGGFPTAVLDAIFRRSEAADFQRALPSVQPAQLMGDASVNHQESGEGTPIYRGPLSKAVLMQLPEGAYVMSGVSDDSGAPLLSRSLPVLIERSALWIQLKSLGVDSRNCYVFENEREYRAFLAKNPVVNPPPGSPFPKL
jgi:hypothetical protein